MTTEKYLYEWRPEGDGFTLYQSAIYGLEGPGRNCGRLNTGATMSTCKLAQLYNAAPELLEAAQIGLACCLAWGGKCAAKGESILAAESVRKAEFIRKAIESATHEN